MLLLPPFHQLGGKAIDPLYRIAGSVPALHLSPRLRGDWKDLISGIDPTIFTRANTAPTCELNGAGGLTAFNSGERAIGYSPETGIRGGSIFGQRTQGISDPTLATGWTASNATFTPNAATAPGGISAGLLVENNSSGSSVTHVLSRSYTFNASTTYVFSGIAKIGPGPATRGIRLTLPTAAFGNNPSCSLRFENSPISTSSVNSPLATFLIPLADGWYRWALAATATTGGTGNININLTSANTSSYPGDGTSGVYVTGVNMTEGSVLYPYLGGAITCPADVLTIDGTNFSQWYTSAGMVILARFSNGNIATSTTDSYIFDFSNSSNTSQRFSSRIGVQSITRGTMRSFVNTGSSFEYAVDSGIYASGTNGKIAIRCGATNDFATSFNGSAEATDTIGSIGSALSSFNQLRIGDQSLASAPFNGYIHDLLAWPISSPAGQRLQQLSAAP